MNKKSQKSFYTLVEIMTVIVIAAILFGIGIPAFTTMIQGSNMTVAIRQLSAKISAARAYAVTNRCRVAVLLMETNIKTEYRSSAYRVCVVNSENAFQEWIEDENWKTLPTGIYRATLTNISTTVSNVDADDIGGGTAPLAPKALIFDSKGQLKLDERPKIKLKHGRYVEGSTMPVNTSGEDYELTINQYSGKVTVTVPNPS